MKTIIALILLALFCNGNPHYLMQADACSNIAGTFFNCEDGHVRAVDGDRYTGSVVLVMDNNGTPDNPIDDLIAFVIER